MEIEGEGALKQDCWESNIRLTLLLTTVDCSSSEAQHRKEALS